MDKIAPASIEWSIRYHKRYGDTDLFPPRTEFELLYQNLDHVRDVLSQIDFSKYDTHDRANIAVPKSDGTFRVASFLHPLDSILALAAIHEHSEAIEKSRIGTNHGKVFSYRRDSTGWFSASMWSEYTSSSLELAQFSEYVLVVDISDFYNQIYVHKVQNALELAGLPAERAAAIHDFLIALNHKNSQGLPIGPEFSRILAELVLNDVDRWIDSFKVPFTRYVDDYKFFFESYGDALSFFSELTKFLHNQHRLAINSRKSKILRSETFQKNLERDPEKLKIESNARHASIALNNLIEALSDEDLEWIEDEESEYIPYVGRSAVGVIPVELLEQLESKAEFLGIVSAIKEMFELALSGSEVDTGLAKYALSLATSKRVAAVLPTLLNRFSLVAPVFREVCLYIDAVSPRITEDQWKQFQYEFTSSHLSRLEHCQRWILWLASNNSVMRVNGLSRKIFDGTFAYVDGGTSICAWHAAQHNGFFFNQYRETIRSQTPEFRRALICGSKILSKSERWAYLEGSVLSGDTLENLLATAIRSK